MFRKFCRKAARLVADLPEGPRDMVDRLRKGPLPYKFIISAGLAAVLAAAYAASKKSGPVPLPVEGETCSPAQDTLPYPASFEAFSFPPLDVDPAYSVSDELAAYQGEVGKAIVCSPYREAIEAAGENLRIQASRFEDGSGGRRDYVFVSQFGPAGVFVPFTIQTKTGSFEVPFFFYTDSKGSLFAPPGEGDEGVPGVLLPVGVWFEGDTAYWGFGIEVPDETIQSPEPGNFLFKEDYGDGTITFRDPYSGKEYSWNVKDQQPQSGGVYQVVTQTNLMPEGWVDVNGTPVSPEFIALQEKIAESQNFTLTPAGLEVKLPDGTIKQVSDVKVAPDGTVTVVVNGQTVTAFDIEIKDNKLFLKTENGVYVWTEEGWVNTALIASIEGMTDRYLERFETVQAGTRVVDGVETNVVIGVDEGGVKSVIGMEIDGVMRRVGEYTNQDGRSYYVYVNGDTRLSRMMLPTGRTAYTLFHTTSHIDPDFSLFISIGRQLGVTPERAEELVWENGGQLEILVPAGVPESSAKFPVRFIRRTLNFNRPIEIKIINTPEEFGALSSDERNALVYPHSFFHGYEFIRGGGLIVDEQGGITIITVDYDAGQNDNLDWVLNPTPDQIPGIPGALSERVGANLIMIIDLIGWTEWGGNALRNALRKYDNFYEYQAKLFFEYYIPLQK